VNEQLAAKGSSTKVNVAAAVTVRKLLASPDHILSMIDGKPYKTLKRHLARNWLTPEQYRERYSFKPDYPMTAPTYSEHRRAMAHKIGLGAKGRQAKSGQQEAAAPAKPARGRPRKAATYNRVGIGLARVTRSAMARLRIQKLKLQTQHLALRLPCKRQGGHPG
jgi:hypothetical protein